MEKCATEKQETCQQDITIGLAVGRVLSSGRSYIHQRRWSREHLKSVGCMLTTEEANEFKRLCDEMGVTRYATIRALVKTWIYSVQVRGY